MRHLLAILAGLVLVGSSGVPALAQEELVVAPPGNSGVDEILEIVPAAGGDRPAGGSGGQRARTPSSAPPAPRAVLGAKTAKALRRLGPDGRAAAAVAAAGAPSDARGARRNATKNALGNSEPDGSIATEDGGGRAGAVASALAGGGGVGLAFPLLLLGALAAALGLLAIRRITRR